MVVLTSVLVLLVSVGWWVYAENVVTAAVQDGARVASARDASTAQGLAVAQRLLDSQLGAGASNVHVTAGETSANTSADAREVLVSASGSWPVFVGAGVEIGFPLGATSRILKERWH